MRHLLMIVLCLASTGASYEASCDQSSKPAASQVANSKVYSASEVDQRMVIKSRPEPAYTDKAYKKDVVGIVELRAVFAATGKVEQIEVLRGLPEGLTESAIKAAKEIKFKPAKKNGQAVSVYARLQYNFQWR